mgnify:FL=1
MAYNESIPHFEQLDNLKLIPEIKEKSTNQSKELIDSINQLNRSLSNISNRIDNQSVLAKLDAIEKSLKRRSSTVNSTEKQTAERSNKKGFFKNLRSRFSRKNKTTNHEEE